MIDPEPTILFTISDLKQYIYCPRIFFYHACLPAIRPVTYKMQAGIDAHESERKKAVRRSLKMYGEVDGQRHFDVAIQSNTLYLSGLIDEVVQTDKEWIPIDYKLAQHDGFHFKIQLTAYALLLEEQTTTKVKRGFLYLIPKRQTVEVAITAALRHQVHQALESMYRIATQESMPQPTDWRQRCPDCEFKRFCNDV
jgi:CRISPR-associated exonuclease Cas4